MKRTSTKRLIEAALMVALATVLSIIKVVEMPYGGSVTLASMLPIIILSYRNGLGWGMGGALTYAVIQQLLGLKTLSYFTTPESVIAIILLDYILAFAVAGLGGLFRRIIKRQSSAIVIGSVCVSALRYICHVISGCTVWVGLSIPDAAAFWYSIGYNATYMLPEAIILAAVGYYLCDMIDFTKDVPTRTVRRARSGEAGMLYSLSGLLLLLGLITDVVLIAPTLQNEVSGMFDLAGLLSVNWLAVGIVTALAVAVAVGIFVYAVKKENKGSAAE